MTHPRERSAEIHFYLIFLAFCKLLFFLTYFLVAIVVDAEPIKIRGGSFFVSSFFRKPSYFLSDTNIIRTDRRLQSELNLGSIFYPCFSILPVRFLCED